MSFADEVTKLQELLQAGSITQEIFAEERDRLLHARRTESREPRASTPSQIGAYRIHGRIGSGGMGAVYRGQHTQAAVMARQGGEIAIKLMHPQYAAREDFRARFDREADVGVRLDHPNVVKAHDLVIDGDRLALVMEWVEGRPLSDVIGKETGPIPWNRAWPLFEQLLAGMEHAHAHGVVHRDLKPENVMVTSEGKVKILDFGIAKAGGHGGTKTGTGLGTVDYMAPEQYLDAKRVDHRADIYALGMTMYEALAGRLPWAADTSEFEVLTRKSNGDVPPPTDFYPSIPPAVVGAVMAALSVSPDHRPHDINALRSALSTTAGRARPVERNQGNAVPVVDSDIATDGRADGEQAPDSIPIPVTGDDGPLAKLLNLVVPLGLLAWLVLFVSSVFK